MNEKIKILTFFLCSFSHAYIFSSMRENKCSRITTIACATGLTVTTIALALASTATASNESLHLHLALGSCLTAIPAGIALVGTFRTNTTSGSPKFYIHPTNNPDTATISNSPQKKSFPGKAFKHVDVSSSSV